MKNILDIKNLSYSFGNNPILKDINIHVNENEMVAIVGSSGVGKSTLFNLIAGVLKKQAGKITINGSEDYIGKVAYMLQKDLLFEHKTIIDNVILPLIIAKIDKKEALEEGNKILKQFNLDKYANKYPQQLSGGMRQRVALIRTYMFKKNIFLLDEAFSALDAITKKELHKWYLDLKKEFNLTTLLITHDIEEAVFLSDRIYILGNKPGEIIGEIKIEINPNEDIDVQRLFYKKEILNIMNIE
ncbi:ABC transporter ATP-binding protein [Fusobacterium nucleatum subsp. nucleatum ATCC 23726]|uniref:Nitrate ABC transporter ATP-binding protein n=2 Tax=Fusobacterium nucleatum subsp. nucleatum TaxID=76856 RepID=A0A0M4S1C4_FUSNC|nr:ABC transporter ATP-binding protein [Fusobacterium nucleatum]ALF23684.1 nitrate ABC transporter ATP-binding protein [Fusobacterium nucleatum subsp. nucleatum ChDC F316]ALF26641.1 nitrate ABC transporter ATP-binding protein [Fusobacterium nucleatum subsp. nucleatum]ASG26957.1 nitrate ABC transporter ATP-binding protein [Fusobacterium nucleatum subsp. nucleatum]AVQ22919.1 ABC transporter ATP-binding protein [Fusobacterium nucleatum subsp. nucleatum ATCC 23726]EFG96013.1 ABC transporter, ATP-b